MLEWFYNNETLSWWLLAISLFSFLATLIAVPIILVRIPQDYFVYTNRHRITWQNRNRFMRLPLLLIKNLLGLIFILLGILMLVLPGQGLLTILIGLVLLDFPGKYRVERWFVNQTVVLRSINWVRLKAGKDELVVSPGENSDR
jgi:archaellum biogenesis protein FlaJ (TadC family)